MSDLLEHRGYLGSVHYSKEDNVLHGRLEFIRDLVTYEAQDLVGLKAAFQESIDDYLQFCRDHGCRPDVPLKWSFNVRPMGCPRSEGILPSHSAKRHHSAR